jgi:hypothetical protein
MIDRELNDMTEAQLAQWQYAHRKELDAEEGEVVDFDVDFDVAPHVSVTMSFRLPGPEADAIRAAAQGAGMTLSEWIRQACADAIRPSEAAAGRREVEAALNDLTKHLDQARKRLQVARVKSRAAVKKSRTKTTARKVTTKASKKSGATVRKASTSKKATAGTATRGKRSS